MVNLSGMRSATEQNLQLIPRPLIAIFEVTEGTRISEVSYGPIST